MKKHNAIALLLVLSAILLAGCRNPMDDGMTDPSTGDGSPTVSTTLPVETLMTEPTTIPTAPSTEGSTPTQDMTEPSATQDTTDATEDTLTRGRGRPMN